MKNKHILVTGAGGGIGGGLVEYLLAQGFTNVSCQYRNHEGQLPTLFGSDFAQRCIKADLTSEADVTNLRTQIQPHGKLWGLVNLAGASTNAMSWKMSKDDFSATIDANLLTTFLTCREFIPEMREQGGRIINTSSVVAFAGTIGAAHYCAAKAGIVGLTRALSLELANKAVTANVLALGYFDRGLITHLNPQMQDDIKARTPLKRFGHVEEIGGQVKFLLSDEGAFTTGQTIHMNGGFYL